MWENYQASLSNVGRSIQVHVCSFLKYYMEGMEGHGGAPEVSLHKQSLKLAYEQYSFGAPLIVLKCLWSWKIIYKTLPERPCQLSCIVRVVWAKLYSHDLELHRIQNDCLQSASKVHRLISTVCLEDLFE
jgi:hypothetical protein